MKTIALFSNKGGVGRTSIAYHLGFMLAELGRHVVFGDLDPQANLSAMCLTGERLEAIWTLKPRPTIYGVIERLRHGVGDVDPLASEPLSESVALVTGDLQLSEFEDDLSQQWPKCLEGDERAFRITTALHRVVMDAGTQSGADIAILDVGPNFGAINRAAMIAADYVIVPVAPDRFSMQGLENIGPRLAAWRQQWNDRRTRAPTLDFELPHGEMTPLGYVVAPHPMYAGWAIRPSQPWIDHIPEVFRKSFSLPEQARLKIASDEFCLAQLRNYHSLMLMAEQAKRPMFMLKPADGAIGGHQGAVRQAYDDFRKLAERIIHRMGSFSG